MSTRKLIVESGANYFDGKYSINEKLGQGGFGRVFKATKKSSGEAVCLKLVSKDSISEYTLHEKTHQKVPIEAALLSQCQGIPGVIKLIEIIDLIEYDAWCIIMEHIPNSIDLFDFITQNKRIPEETAVFILNQLLHTLLDCHKAGVVHRDIKDENILIDIDTKEIKLIDFGSGHYYHKGEYFDFNGTILYSPPEWIRHKHYFAKQLETWQIGILLSNMITGDVPFKTLNDIFRDPVFMDSLSTDCQDLILSCLCRDRKKRIEFDKILCHKLFKKYHKTIAPQF